MRLFQSNESALEARSRQRHFLVTMTMMMLAVVTRRPALITVRTISRKVSVRCLSTGPITLAYEKLLKDGKLRHDEDQWSLAGRLDHLHQSLASTDARVRSSADLHTDMFTDTHHNTSLVQYVQQRFWKMSSFLLEPTPPKGLYIYGPVGVGKSLLMDLFFEECQTISTQRKQKRVHFHEFMLDVHSRIHSFKQQHPRRDALPAVALQLARESRLLCFDEFQVTDIADAMILKRLFGMLLEAGVVVVATSNRPPFSLYEGGINRTLFLPFIDTLTGNLDVVEMTGETDYRRDERNNVTLSSRFFWPAHDKSVRVKMEHLFYSDGTSQARSQDVSVMMGRIIKVPRATDTTAWFDFMDLCGNPLGAADYLALCNHYKVLMIDSVPQLNSSRFNEARRFVTLIDALYETRTKLVMSCHVPLDDLFVDFDATVETNDGDEEIAIVEEPAIQNQTGDEEMFVKGEGGSSSSAATTMIRTKDGDVEWSATGRIGVSLAQLSAVRDVAFSFERAESRLAEMNRSSWGQ